MAELVTIDGQQYKKRDPLGVLGLSFITLGIYWFYWYYTINDEIRRFEKDDTVRPGMALLADHAGVAHHRAAVHLRVQHVEARRPDGGAARASSSSCRRRST